MQFKKVTVPGGATIEAPSVPPLSVWGWVNQILAGVAEARVALANPGAAVHPCPPELAGVGWVEMIEEGE